MAMTVAVAPGVVDIGHVGWNHNIITLMKTFELIFILISTSSHLSRPQLLDSPT